MIKIQLQNGQIKNYPVNSCGIDIARDISTSLSKSAIAIEVNGVLTDLQTPLNRDCEVRIITHNDNIALEIMRHDTAHVLAEAAKEVYGQAVQITIGPAIENGFYYDLAINSPISSSDLEVLEAKMHEIVRRNNSFIREEWQRNDAITYFKSIGEHYKAEIVASIPENEVLTIYRQGDFLDLCKGPHAQSTGYLKHFKLLRVSGAYWRGDPKNAMLQRIYGTAHRTKEELDRYLLALDEAAKRYHMRIGKELNLFHIQEEARGMVFWHPKGLTLYKIIENHIREKFIKYGYREVKTPQLVDRKLWEMSGHWEKYRPNMFITNIEDGINREVLALKPMNCPCHVQIFNHSLKSYRDLPLRMAEFGACHRFEPSGALHGLMRVRSFTQDDAHIFCEESQIISESVAFCQQLKEIYADFGFTDIRVKFSDRPEIRAGDDTIWDDAEKALMQAADAAGLDYTISKGEGAFYGPKLEFVLIDALGREWQCGTLQVDFVLPERLNASYIGQDGQKHRPAMLHRATLGSMERFIAILIEHYNGKLPLWLAPIQVCIATITHTADEYAKFLYSELTKNNIRSIIDCSNEKINYKIRLHSNQKIPIIAIVGEKEMTNKTLSLRRLGSDEITIYTMDEFIQLDGFIHSQS